MGKSIRRPQRSGGQRRARSQVQSPILKPNLHLEVPSRILTPAFDKKCVFNPSFNPPRSPAQSARPPQKVCWVGPFRRSKFRSFLDFDFGRFRGRLGSLLGGHFGPLGPPSSLKMPSRGHLKAYLCQKRRFCSHTTFSNTKTAFWTPRRRPKRPKIGPRRLQDGLEEGLFRF